MVEKQEKLCCTKENAMERKLKILALHGYRQNSEVFRQKTGALRKMVHKWAQFTYITAPHRVTSVDNIDGGEELQASVQNGGNVLIRRSTHRDCHMMLHCRTVRLVFQPRQQDFQGGQAGRPRDRVRGEPQVHRGGVRKGGPLRRVIRVLARRLHGRPPLRFTGTGTYEQFHQQRFYVLIPRFQC